MPSINGRDLDKETVEIVIRAGEGDNFVMEVYSALSEENYVLAILARGMVQLATHNPEMVIEVGEKAVSKDYDDNIEAESKGEIDESEQYTVTDESPLTVTSEVAGSA